MSTWSKADIHIHTTFSDGLNEPEAVVNYALTQTNLRVIAITDHNTIDGARVAHKYWLQHRDTFHNLAVIKGVEVSSSDGHILGLFLEEDIPMNMTPAETIRAIHEQGGLAIAAHPFTHLLPFTDFHGIGRQIAHLPLDGVEARSSVPTELYANWLTAWYNRRHACHAALGSSDAHYLTMIGKTFTWFPGKTAADFREAVSNQTVRAGGRVNGPIAIWQVIVHLFSRRQMPVFLPSDSHHRHVGAGLTVDVEIDWQRNLGIVYPAGQITHHNAVVLGRELDRLYQAGQQRILVNLTGVEFVDSAGLGVLIAGYKQMEGINGRFCLCAPRPEVTKILQLVRLDRVFTLYRTETDALTALAVTPSFRPFQPQAV